MRVAIVDDHDVFRASVVRLLEDEVDIDVVAEGASAQEAVAIAGRMDLDVIVLDWQLPDGNGVDAATAITSIAGAPKVIMLTGYATVSVQSDALRSGVALILGKDEAAMQLADAIRGFAVA
jgi:DNA-binding NarL/FixJ family response regulator